MQATLSHYQSLATQARARVTALELALLNDPKHTTMGPLDKRHPLDKIATAMIRSGQPVVVGVVS